MNLDSFEEEIESPIILSRGLSYYRGKNVVSLEMIEANHYKAFVAGTQLYEVTLTLDDDGEVEDIHCTCPYDWGEHCKHEVAVLYALRHQLNREQYEMVERPKDVDLSSLLEARSKKELLSFLLDFAKKSPPLVSALVAAFPSSDEEVNLTNMGIQFRRACDDGIESTSEEDEYGWDDDGEEDDWQFSSTFKKKIEEFLVMARSAIKEGNIHYGGSIAAMMVHELCSLDYDSENLLDEVQDVIMQVGALFDDKTLKTDDASWLFALFFSEVMDYDDVVQEALLSLCLQFAETESDQEVLKKYLVALVADETEGEWGLNSTILNSLKLQHALLIKQERKEDAQWFALSNLSYEAMRKLAFDYNSWIHMHLYLRGSILHIS